MPCTKCNTCQSKCETNQNVKANSLSQIGSKWGTGGTMFAQNDIIIRRLPKADFYYAWDHINIANPGTSAPSPQKDFIYKSDVDALIDALTAVQSGGSIPAKPATNAVITAAYFNLLRDAIHDLNYHRTDGAQLCTGTNTCVQGGGSCADGQCTGCLGGCEECNTCEGCNTCQACNSGQNGVRG